MLEQEGFAVETFGLGYAFIGRMRQNPFHLAFIDLQLPDIGGLEILKLIAQGLSNREIGARLFLALDTVKGHNRRIFDKLEVQRRTEAIARARELGLL